MGRVDGSYLRNTDNDGPSLMTPLTMMTPLNALKWPGVHLKGKLSK